MSDLLKGNFQTQKDVKAPEETNKDTNKQFRQEVMNSIGGSMVYVERTPLTWDPEENKEK